MSTCSPVLTCALTVLTSEWVWAELFRVHSGLRPRSQAPSQFAALLRSPCSPLLTPRVDAELNAIKGGGACQLREKVLADMADTWVMVADFRKNSSVLGTNVSSLSSLSVARPLAARYAHGCADTQWKQGVPIEVVPFAYVQVLAALQKLGGTPVLRMGKAKAGPVVSDNGGFIIDCAFPEPQMRQPAALLSATKLLTGVVEVGLFCGMAKAAYFGNEDGSVTLRAVGGVTEHIASVPDLPPTATA